MADPDDLVAEIQQGLEGLTISEIEEKAWYDRQVCDQEGWSEEGRREYSVHVWLALERSPRNDAEVEQSLAAWLRGFGIDAAQFAADLVLIATTAEELAITRGQGDPERLRKFWALSALTGPSSLEDEEKL